MNAETAASLINNIALLMALSIIQETSYMLPIQSKKVVQLLQGMLIGLISIAVMTVPFHIETGINIDTRIILISVTGLMFGSLTTVIAALTAVLYRLNLGGEGMILGSILIVFSAAFGIFWRRLFIKSKRKTLNCYLFGIIVNSSLFSVLLILSETQHIRFLSEIMLPIMISYPAATVLLTMLLFHQRNRADAYRRVMREEEWYKSFFNNQHTIMLLIDSGSGRIIDANPAAVAFYGWPLPILVSLHITDIDNSPPDEIRTRLKKSVNENYTYYVTKHRQDSGKLTDVEIHMGALKLNGKTVLYAIIHDISKRLAANRALLESEQRFRLVVESAPDAIYMMVDGRFAFLNKYAISLFGAEDSDTLIGTPVIERFHSDYRQSVLEQIEILIKEKKPVPLSEEKIIRLDGSVLDIDINAVPIHFNQIDAGLVFARDVSERKRLEEAHKAMEAQLREQQKLEAIGTLAAGVAHEINNPINGIMNYAQLILDSKELSDSQTEYTREIIRETERVSNIVKNLLQFSRQEKQSHSYANINDIVNKTTSLINTLIKKDQIELDIQLEENLPNIKCRSQQIQQVLMNLLTNARDALNERYRSYSPGKIIRLSANKFSVNGEKWIRIVVEDHGNGIPQAVLDKIFNPFFSTKDKDKGTGLGLSISFGIIKEHNGKIRVDTKEGAYSKFIIELPCDNGWKISDAE